MLAWRSFLRRSSPLASRLGPVRRRHGATKPVANRPAPAPKKGHLYMVLDDHKIDYGIYKLDVDADLRASCSSDDDSPRQPPRPAFRLEVPKITCPGEPAQFAAAGGCIIATRAGSQDDGDGGETSEKKKKKQLAWGRWHHDDGSGASRCAWSDTGRKVVDSLPFSPNYIAAHAVLGLTIYVSVSGFYGAGAETFAYDTTTRGDWTECGDWAMPFLGAAAGYDADLGAWVGLHATGRCQGTGHLASCRVPDESGGRPEMKVGGEKMLLEDPDWKHAEDGAKLVYMGGRGEYCLFERLRRREEADRKKGCWAATGRACCFFERLRRGEGADVEECRPRGGGGGCERLLLLTTFRVGYDEAGELTATDRRTTRYKVPSYRDDFEAQAFWI